METPSPSETNPLRVAIVSESSLEHMSGVTTSVKRVLDHLDEERHAGITICPGPAPDTYANAPTITTPHVRLKGFNIGITSSGALREHLEDFNPDVIHNASPFGFLGGAAVRAAKQLEIPVVSIYQTDMPEYAKSLGLGILSPLAAKRVAHIHNNSALNLAPSSAAIEGLVGYGADRGRVDLWRRGVDASRFTAERHMSPAVVSLREQWSPDNVPIIGYVGRLAPEKRVERLAALQGIDAQLVIVGDGPSRKSVEAQTPDGTIFTGELRGEALADAYAAFDIFVHTGTAETFGQTLQEAMASGKPVVAPAAGGPLDIVQTSPLEGKNATGFLYGAEDDTMMRSQVEQLVKNPELRASMGQAGREFILPRTWKALCAELVDYYRSVQD